MALVKVLVRKTKGGPGSGNWGHAGIPGQVGGSAPGSGSSSSGSGNNPSDPIVNLSVSDASRKLTGDHALRAPELTRKWGKEGSYTGTVAKKPTGEKVTANVYYSKGAYMGMYSYHTPIRPGKTDVSGDGKYYVSKVDAMKSLEGIINSLGF